MIDAVRDGLLALWTAPYGRAALIFAAGFVVLKLAAALVARSLSRGSASHRSMVARKAVMYIGTVALFLGAAGAADIDLTTYLAAAGVLTVAVGFAAQTSIGNLIAGIFLIIDRPFEVGDHVQIEGKHGHIEAISLMSTHIRTFDNLLVRWPNEFVLRAMIINFARNPAWRLEIPFRIHHGADIARARQVVSERAKRSRHVLIDPPPVVWGIQIEEHGIGLELRAWIDREYFLEARTDLVAAIHDGLRAANIEIPYPQLTVSRGQRLWTDQEDAKADAEAVLGPAQHPAERLDAPALEPDAEL